MSHYFPIEDVEGNLVEVVPFCSDWCHRDWCRQTGNEYKGWNGCHEHDQVEECANCGDIMLGLDGLDEEVTA
jgi:hypothetical protein